MMNLRPCRGAQRLPQSMKDMQAQQILLYREHLATEATFRAEIKGAQTELDEANAEKKGRPAGLARLDQLVAVLEAEMGGRS